MMLALKATGAGQMCGEALCDMAFEMMLAGYPFDVFICSSDEHWIVSIGEREAACERDLGAALISAVATWRRWVREDDLP